MGLSLAQQRFVRRSLPSDYNRAREYLEEEVDQRGEPIPVDEFKKKFNQQLFDAKGEDWIRRGLLLPVEEERRRRETREAFFREFQETQGALPGAVDIRPARRKRRKTVKRIRIRGRYYRYHLVKHRILGKWHNRSRKGKSRVKESRPSQVKSGRR